MTSGSGAFVQTGGSHYTGPLTLGANAGSSGAYNLSNGVSSLSAGGLTTVGHTKDELAEVLDQLAGGGIENVLALRGDPPRGQTHFVKTEGGFEYGQEAHGIDRPKSGYRAGDRAKGRQAHAEVLHLTVNGR